MPLNIGDKAPNFSMPTSNDGVASLSDYKGRYLILYFYPKDDTPGCTKEAIGFSGMKSTFDKLGADILGISKDTAAKHDKFIAKHDLTVKLGSDVDGEMIENYGVWVEKNMYGKKYMGIERTTYLIAPDGNILEIWRKVRVKQHVEAVFETLKTHIGQK